ncbi:S8 family serine peptidase [Actinomyces bouchesdurhonensis]|uniref:S8 family serine peptidase n=1 Tax=Actinomyces bouchesdurhonensis TaxID=1852361 RepID=UPI0023F2C249|nr:S8 family serine peptidase [Actinomyces bouchesdurhonensis]
MRRTAARIGVVAALALSMGVTTVVVPPAHADDTSPLISSTRANDDQMNYAINLAPGTSSADVERAIALVPSVKGAALASYPQIGTFFAQSATPSFAPDLAATLRDAGIPVHSIGPTRTQEVLYYERLTLPTGEETPAGDNAGGDNAGGDNAAPGGLAFAGDEAATEAQAGAEERIFNWGAEAMHAREAGAVAVERAPVTVAVVDSGVEDTHPDLEGRVDTQRSVKCSVNGVATQDLYGWRDEFYHGTHVAGIIAANHNDIGIDGIAPQARIVAIQATNDNRLIYPEYVTCAFMWAADHGVDIVNNSYSMDPWVYWSPTDPEQAAGLEAATRSIKYAQGKGLAVIAAAGNEGVNIDNPTIDDGSPTDAPAPTKGRDVQGGIRVPSMIDGVAQVSALAQAYNVAPGLSLARADFSNYGTTIDFAAPGDQIYSTAPLLFYLSGYAVADGTSMATPHVSGVAALIKSVHPEYTGAQVIDLMKKQAARNYGELNAPWDGKEYRGSGFLDALDAVLKDQPRPQIGQIEYSTDGTAWTPLDGQELSGSVSVRVTVGGPMTSARVLVGGGEVAAATGAGELTGDVVTLRADGVDVSALSGEQVVRVEASGRNPDPRADDDVTTSALFTVAPASEDTHEAVAGQWISDALGWWWRNTDGTYPASETLRINGEVYRFDARGYMVTGWASENGHWFYYGVSGAQASGWVSVGGTWYYLDPATGAMVTGWLKEGSSWYYLQLSGAMATGWVRDASSWYYLDETGVMVTGERTIDGVVYFFDPSGRLRS